MVPGDSGAANSALLAKNQVRSSAGMSALMGAPGEDLSRAFGHHAGDSKPESKPNLSDLPDDIAFLTKFGMGKPTLLLAAQIGRSRKIPAATALILSGAISEKAYYQSAAEHLGLPFVQHTPVTEEPFPEPPTSEQIEQRSAMVPVNLERDGQNYRVFHIAPDMNRLSPLYNLLSKQPGLANRLRVTTRSANRSALERRAQPALSNRAVNRLWNTRPEFSARTVITVSQAIFLLLSVQALLIVSIFSSGLVVLATHLAASLLYLSCVLLRLWAALSVNLTKRSPEPPWANTTRPPDSGLPIYTVLVALYEEAGQVNDLVASLLKLDWPREKLDIKLVCEADDEATIRAVNTALAPPGRSHITVVAVPPQQPRTKPKALNYAMPLSRGGLLVIYDAEDRPHPQQLREAHERFTRSEGSLACLQAPLVIHNHREHWLTRLFAIEYSTLFDGLLPHLASHGLPLPLGGTSNHFKRAVLDQVGGWDPYNVTEDADLGIRLSRHGYQIGVLSYPTFEEAPIALSVWVKQRTRWFKGWFQTWLVHMRHPIVLWRDLGARGFIAFQVMVSGMVVSALIHPVLIYLIGATTWRGFQHGWSQWVQSPIFWLDALTVLLGYATFCALAWRTLPVRGLTRLRSSLIGLPVYWMLLSVGAWRALWHLIQKPHHWEKTPHRLRSTRDNFSENASTISNPGPDNWTSNPPRKVLTDAPAYFHRPNARQSGHAPI